MSNKINAQEVITILKKHGTQVTTDQAEEILKFMRMLAEIEIAQYLRKHEQQTNLKNCSFEI